MVTDFAGLAGVAIVSGGSGGIGRAICLGLARAGSAVAFTYRSNDEAADRLTAELSEHGQTGIATRLDLGDAAATAAFVEEVADRFGAVHTLVHAAGPHVPMTHLSRVTPAVMREQVEQDLLGFYNLVHPTLPHLRRSKGSVVAVTTAATTRYPKRDGLSSVPKAGVEALARALAAEEGRFGVRVNCVGPGMLTDGMASRLIASRELDEVALDVARANIPLGRFGTAEDIAQAVLFLASHRAGFISGQKIDVDGGYGV
ncbi:SDR family oxidoreductase [Microtetraspora sp. AC03309]|uniref:SDR family NAD(P)-dependent oxidoreductase n=1 Tax=Microtetraspora sp. AC03309 TaxID=2779376 RepID=UPI001E42E5B3|nr:SDR family oxidoreductase [Microtetraspora sp. AC03309]MCC5576331.1 SDR family oxidoreductase [Microtetraspora sp. AC03309]